MAMTQAEVAAWLASQGVSESVIANEAGYVAEHYADPDEDPMKVLQASLGSYLQRTESGGNRNDDGGYDTNYDDPAIVTDWGTAAARADSPLVGYDPAQPAIQGGVLQATTGSPVMTALQASNAPLIARTQAAVAAQRTAATATGARTTTTTGTLLEGDFAGDFAAASASPLVPVGLAIGLLKLFGAF